MKWVDYIIETLKPAFGGIPTFCEDPDHLLDLPEVREALRCAGMTITDYDGLPTSLIPLKSLSDDEMPLLIVGEGAHRHIVEACLTDARWEVISVGELMPKFAQDVVKAIPTDLWDRLLTLHQEVRSPRTPQETALLIGRALYGVDPEFLKHGDGWFRLLTRIAVTGETLPMPLSRALTEQYPLPAALQGVPLPDALVDASDARTTLFSILKTNPDLYEHASRAELILLETMRQMEPTVPTPVIAPDLMALWEQASQKPQTVLEFGLTYADTQAAGSVPDALRLKINQTFTDWLKLNYGYIQSNPAVLRLPTLLKTLDEEYDGQHLLLVVVDSLGLHAWATVQKQWIADGVIASAETRAAFAVLPTITSLSRRAIFEGKLPSQFSSEPHSPRLERKLWTTRYGGDGDYFSVDEALGFADCLAKGKPRICVVDVTWDKRGHSIDPRTDSINDAARTWGGRTPLRDIVKAGLEQGYRVVITADHAQVECRGRGRLNVGVLSEERSKRVVLFNDKTVCNNAMKEWTDNFRPVGLPQNMFPLFAADFHSFDLDGATTVSHGGLSLEEVLVPVAELFL